MKKLPTIIYIVGRGHSGSTLLDLLISSHSATISVGEIKSFSQKKKDKGRHLLEEPCTCGAAKIRDCKFWTKVNGALQKNDGLTLDVLDVYHDDPETFKKHNRALYRAVQEVSGKNYIVDSSKDIKRLAWLVRCGCFDIRPVHLMRNPLGVINSQIRLGHDWVDHTRKYTAVTMQTRRLLRDVQYWKIRYEDLAGNPGTTLAETMRWLGLSYEKTQLNWPTHLHHNVNGNRMRFKRNKEIKVDNSWQKSLSRRQKLRIRWMTFPTKMTGTWLYESFPALWNLNAGEKRRIHLRTTVANFMTNRS